VLKFPGANRGQKRPPNGVSVSVALKCDANESENPIANALFALLVPVLVGDSVPA